MSSLVFSLGSEDAAELAVRELKRNGVREEDIRVLDPHSHRLTAENTADPQLATAELDREIAQGRVLLDVRVDEQNQPAVERLIEMLGGDARRLVMSGRLPVATLAIASSAAEDGTHLEPAT
jgi:hypothetical protein